MKTIKYLLSALIFMAGTSCDSEVSQRDTSSQETDLVSSKTEPETETITNEPKPLGTMMRIPAGKFIMGNLNDDGLDSQKPAHEVYVSTFFISNVETTFELWTEVREWGLNNGYQDVGRAEGKDTNHPVHSISWYDVVKWCNARSEKEGLKPCYRVGGSIFRTGEDSEVVCDFEANGYRLPTEAEWEKAARGGLEGKSFPWGDVKSQSEANFQNGGVRIYALGSKRYQYHPDWEKGEKPYSSPVGSFAANGYGLYDMAGNMWEWCWDWYGKDYYSSSPASDPRGPSSGKYRVARGCSWKFIRYGDCRVAFRGGSNPTQRHNADGFRLARSSVSQ